MKCDDDSLLIKEFYEISIGKLMNNKFADMPIIQKDAPIENVLSILDGRSHVWIVNDLKKRDLVGVITRQDVLHILAPPQQYYNIFSIPKQYIHGTCGVAEDVMTKDPISCEPNETVVQILVKMMRHRVRRIAVIENNMFIGEITLRHLIHKYYLASQYHPIEGE
jgi:predicted transcriptional regulator